MSESLSITCPRCGLTSYNASDVSSQYCGNCHEFHADMPEACEACKAARKHAYSDATTPGFFFTDCDYHRRLRQVREQVKIEPDAGPRDTVYHKRIIDIKPIPNTRSGNVCTLECGHVVQTFGSLLPAQGVVLCTQCRDEGMKP